MKKKLKILYKSFFDIQYKILKLIYGDYAFYSLTAKQLILSPTLRQTQAAVRDLSKKTINKYKDLFLKLGLSESKNKLILDVGGNLGYTSIAFRLALKEDSIDIYTFEPYPPSHDFIRKNIFRKNIVLFPFGLGDKNKIVDIGLPDYTYSISNQDDRSNTGRVSMVGIDNSINDDLSQKAYVVHADEMLKSIYMNQNVAFIKIDVEGFELDVLKGLSDTIKESRPFIQMEANPVTMKMSNTDMTTFKEFAETHDYSIYIWNIWGDGKLIPYDNNELMPKKVCELMFCPKDFII
ncbi:FkbM family methyltransferase [Gammaproteobacteria bacterium]|nr:FkbM family methyltransferase [Gammaproteobacteria bacterium]